MRGVWRMWKVAVRERSSWWLSLGHWGLLGVLKWAAVASQGPSLSDGACGEGVSATASEGMCHCSARLQDLADGQASLTDQCCRHVAVLSMTKPGIPSLGLARSSNCRCLQGSVRWLRWAGQDELESTGLPAGGSRYSASSNLCCLLSGIRFFRFSSKRC